jgi:hypothetical protein
VTILNAAALTVLISLLQTLTISLGIDTGGYCHELFLRGKRFLSQRVPPIQGKKPSCSRMILPDFYRLNFLPEYESKNLGVTTNMLPESTEPTRHQETYLPPMSQTHLPVCEAATNLQLFSLGNLLSGRSSGILEHPQRIPGLFQSTMLTMPKQRPPLPMSKINGSTQFLPTHVTSTNSQMLSLGDRLRESRAMQVPQEDPSRHLWARQKYPPAVQVSQYAGWLGNSNGNGNGNNSSQLAGTCPVFLRPGSS